MADLAHQHSNIRIVRQPQNMGKGAALRRGFTEASGDIILVQDADLEYDPVDYPQLLKPILDGRGGCGFRLRASLAARTE